LSDISQKNRTFLLFSAVIVNKQAVNKAVAHSNQCALETFKKSSEGLLFVQKNIFHSDQQ